MKSSTLAVALALGVLTLSARAQNQDTNNLATALGRFESRPDVLLGQGFGDIGSIPFGQDEVRVRACECRNLASGEKVYGLSVAWGENGRWLRLLVDDDELDGLTDAVSRQVFSTVAHRKVWPTAKSLTGRGTANKIFSQPADFRIRQNNGQPKRETT